MEDITYRFSLERFSAGAYNFKRKRSVTIVYPTLHAWRGYSEDDFERIVRDVVHYFFFERVCLELTLQGLKAPRHCRRFRHSKCHCEYVSKLCTRSLGPVSRRSGLVASRLARGKLACVPPAGEPL